MAVATVSQPCSTMSPPLEVHYRAPCRALSPPVQKRLRAPGRAEKAAVDYPVADDDLLDRVFLVQRVRIQLMRTEDEGVSGDEVGERVEICVHVAVGV